MKNKISFTAVLKDKAKLKPSIGYSQASYASHQKHPTLMEMLQQFQSDPSEQFMINLNHSYTCNQRSRNGSINMIRSRNVQQDPQNNANFQNWIQSMTHSNSNGNSLHKKSRLNSNSNLALKRKSIAKPMKTYQNQQDSSDYNQFNRQNYMLNSNQNSIQRNNQIIQKSNLINSKSQQAKPVSKNGIFFNQKQTMTTNEVKNNVQNEQKQVMGKKSMKEISPVQVVSQYEFKGKEYFPDLGYGQYDYLKQQFDQLKQQKINQINNYGKKSIKRQKVQELVSSVMKSIYSSIQSMANIIKNQKLKKKQSMNQPSQQMLLDSQKNREQEKIENSFDQRQEMTRRRIQQYKGKVNEVMSEIDQMKSKSTQNQNNFGYGQVKTFKNLDHQQPSFRRDFNCYDSQSERENTKMNKDNSTSYQNQMANNSVGYSFSNNLICEHSFNNDLSHNHYYPPNQQKEIYYRKISEENIYKPEIQQAEQSDHQAKFSLPNIDEVKSEHDYNGFDQKNVQSSEEIQYRSKRLQQKILDVDNQYIKNIQSVNYQPQEQCHLPLQSSYKPEQKIFKQFQNQNYYKNEKNKNLQQKQDDHQNKGSTYKYNHIQIKRRESSSPQVSKQPITKQSQIFQSQVEDQEQKTFSNSIKKTRFSSKTFNSYLSGEKNKLYQFKDMKTHDKQQVQKKVQQGIGILAYQKNEHQEQFKKLDSSIRQQEPIRQVCEVQIEDKILNKKISQSKSSYKFNSPKLSYNTSDQAKSRQTIDFAANEPLKQHNAIIKKQQSPYAVAKDIVQQNKAKQYYSYKSSSVNVELNNRLAQSKQDYQRSQKIGFLNGNNRNDYEFYFKEEKKMGLANQNINQNHQKLALNSSKNHGNINNIGSSSLLEIKPISFNDNIKNQYLGQNHKGRITTNNSFVFNVPQQSKKVISIPTSLNKISVNQSIEIDQPSSQDKVNTTNQQIKLSISKYQTSKPAKHITIVSSHRTFSQPVDNSVNFNIIHKQKSSSPKVIDINLTSQVKGLNIRAYQEGKQNHYQANHTEKQNIFQKLSIKQSMNIEPLSETTKENYNSMNRNQGNSQSFTMDESMSKQRKQPLIKLSRNMNSSNAHQSTYGIKKPITQNKSNGGDSIKLSLNRNKININTKKSLKQSLNSSGMDFDLALD